MAEPLLLALGAFMAGVVISGSAEQIAGDASVRRSYLGY